ncbi:hypothetical protein ACHELR_004129 [Vibrio fluvialis]|nr:hypothetical protein [Vibrio fluvialis]ELI1831830.1 hypothetical protein [Vibrio fluvialis]ELO1776082.1 hypothetical protein [Vibrio fluvialis]
MLAITHKNQKKIINLLVSISLVTIIVTLATMMFQSHETYNSVRTMVESPTTNVESIKNTAKTAKAILDNIQSTVLFQLAVIGFCVSLVGLVSSYFMASTFLPVVNINYTKRHDKENEYLIVLCNVGTQDLFIHKAYIGIEKESCEVIGETEKQSTHMLERGKPVTMELSQAQSERFHHNADRMQVFLATNEGLVVCTLADPIWEPTV